MTAHSSRKARIADARAQARASLDLMTSEEGAAITAAARLDPDNPPLDDDEPFEMEEGPKSLILIDADVVALLKTHGPDWQLRANEILRKALGL